MYALYKKELAAFFSSLIGYLAIGVFLVLTGLLLWVFPGGFNILDYGYATLEGLFHAAPMLYLFLIPAITMRLLAEEKKNGTLELLLTKPLTEWGIVWAKFLAGLTLVAVSLLPTLVYYVSVYALGDPAGNIDSGSVAGSYIGLLALSAAFVAMGLFASSATDSQIVAFILAALLCAFCYWGFDLVFRMGLIGQKGLFVKGLGMAQHYESMSRGVVDTRDVLYFLSATALFLMLTRLELQRRTWQK